jgi:hypothetical protein
MIDISFFEIMQELKAFIGGVVLILFTLPVIILTDNLLQIYRLILSILAGGAGYLLTLWFVERKSFIGLVDILGIDRFFSSKGSE